MTQTDSSTSDNGPLTSDAASLSPDSLPRRSRRETPESTPKYQVIADDIAAQIESGELAPGAPIPSETKLMARYGVSRLTVRNTLKVLRAQGLVDVHQGRASTVRASLHSSPDQQLVFDPEITRESTSEGWTFTTWEAHGWSEAEAPRDYRAEALMFGHLLQLADTEPILIRERQLAHANGVEVTHRVYLPFATFTRIPSLVADPLRSPAHLYEALTDAGHTLRWEDNTRTVMPSRREATELDLPDGVPLLVLMRLTLDEHDHPLMLEETRLPGDRVSIVSRPQTG